MSEERIQNLLETMTLEEKVSLLSGANFWMTVPIEWLGIPAIKVTDGPNGARGGGSLVGGVKAASFPVGIALAASWNLALVHQIGQALAEEAQSKGARVLLASSTRAPLDCASSARACPIWCTSARFQLAARAMPTGKLAAFTPPTKLPPPRAPFGPSVTLMAGMPSHSMGTVIQKLAPDRRETFSSSVIVSSKF